jgi:hypothetical protein
LRGDLLLHRARVRAGVILATRSAVRFKKFKFFKVHAPRSFMRLLLYKKKPYGASSYICINYSNQRQSRW